jgi:hypothetical protein
LIHKVILALDAAETFALALAIEGYTPEEVAFYAHLMMEGSLAHGANVGSLASNAASPPYLLDVERLRVCPRGHLIK